MSEKVFDLHHADGSKKRKRILRVWETNLLQPLTGLPPGTTIVEYEQGIDWTGFTIERGELRLWQSHRDKPAELVVYYAPGGFLKVDDVWIDVPAPPVEIPEYDDPDWKPNSLPGYAPRDLPNDSVPESVQPAAVSQADKRYVFTDSDLVFMEDAGQIARAFNWTRGAQMPASMSDIFGKIIPGEGTKEGPYGTLCPECGTHIVMGDEHETGGLGTALPCSWWLVQESPPGEATMSRLQRLEMREKASIVPDTRYQDLADRLAADVPMPPQQTVSLLGLTSESIPVTQLQTGPPAPGDFPARGSIREMTSVFREDKMPPSPGPRDRFRGPLNKTSEAPDDMIRVPINRLLPGDPAQRRLQRVAAEANRRAEDQLVGTRLDLKVPHMLDVSETDIPGHILNPRDFPRGTADAGEANKANPPKPTPQPGSPATGRLDIASPVGPMRTFGPALQSLPKLPEVKGDGEAPTLLMQGLADEEPDGQ